MKTPEEIKKGMECCVNGECKHGSNFEWRGLCKENGGAEDA